MFDNFAIWDAIARVDFRDLADILLVYMILYGLLKLVRGTQAVPTAFGIATLALLYQLARWGELTLVQMLLREALVYAPLAIVVLFQSEIRTALGHLGRTMRNPILARTRARAPRDNFDEVVLAATTLASRKIGALILFERGVNLQNWIETGVKLDAALSYDLLVTIFDTHTPLHDGAVVLRDQRVAAASCFLPLTTNPRLSKELGTRHRAAIGIAEDTDCIAVVVSEETGTISFVSGGVITRHLNSTRLREMLRQAFEPPRPIGEVLPGKPRRKRKRKPSRTSDPDTTAEMASETEREDESTDGSDHSLREASRAVSRVGE